MEVEEGDGESGIHPLRFDIIARMAAAHQALVGYSGSKWTDWEGKWFIINFNEKIMKETANRNITLRRSDE